MEKENNEQRLASKRRKIAKLYIKGTSVYNAANVPILKDILPDEETVYTSMTIQNLKIARDPNYKKEPLILFLDPKLFKQAITEVKKRCAGVPDDRIDLYFALPNELVVTFKPEY